MADYTNTLFSYKGQIPTYLPDRLRLKNGLTRYSYSISIEELNSLGYFGPIEVPNYPENTHLEWSTNNFCYVIVSGCNSDEVCVCPRENQKAYADLIERIQMCPSSFDPDNIYTEEYKKEMGVYKGKLLDLYFKNDLSQLKPCDIPPFPQIHGGLKAQEDDQKQILASGIIPSYKYYYEKYGVIPSIHESLVGWLPLPGDDWVKGSGLLFDSDTQTPIIFGRHCFS
jgi:hypothetical protein